MKQITNFSLHNLSNAEALGYLLIVAEKTDLLTLARDADKVKSFLSAVGAYSDVGKPTLANSFTTVRKEADKVMKDLCLGLRYYVNGFVYHPSEEARQAGAEVFAMIKKYKFSANMGYKHRYPRISSLLASLKELPTDKYNLLGLDVWVEAMSSAYDDFMSLTDEAIAEESLRKVGILTVLRKEAQEAYYTLVRYVNSGVVINSEEPYADFIDNANVLVAEYKAHLAARSTRRKNADDAND